MVGRRVVVIVNLQKKRNDWVRIGFLLEELGPQTVNELVFTFSRAFPERSRSSGSIAGMIAGNQSKGFSRIYIEHQAIYGFHGQLPDIPKSTKWRWMAKISPLKGGNSMDGFKHLNETHVWEDSRK
jgi:hypothetical protein